MGNTYFHLDPADDIRPIKYLHQIWKGILMCVIHQLSKERAIIVNEEINIPQKSKRSYPNFNDLASKLKIMKLDSCSMEYLSLEVTLKKWMKAISYQN